MRVHLGVIGLHPLHFLPIVKVCFIPKHIFLHSTFSYEPNVRVVTPILSYKHLKYFAPQAIQLLCDLDAMHHQ
jgi:hypothetical protein